MEIVGILLGLSGLIAGGIATGHSHPPLITLTQIPMLGVTRSLNAHVSGAMAVWQYMQQHLQKSR